MASNPLVSVIMPFLNAKEFIQEAIESVLKQTYPHWELLLVDDGATDGSSEIALRYAGSHSGQVRYLEHEGHQNRGASASRNMGSSQAKGEYLAFLDADDVWLPPKLERQVAILAAQPEAAMVYGPGLWWYSWTGSPEDRQRDYLQNLGIEPETLLKPPELVNLILQHEELVPASFSVMVRREILERVGGSEESCRSIYDDQIVYSKIGLEAPVYISGECWYWYRQHPNQRVNVNDQSGQYYAVRLAFLKWLEAYFSRQGVKHAELWTTLYLEIALTYLACADLKQSAGSLSQALQYGLPGPDEFARLFKVITAYALAVENKNPLQSALDLFEPLSPTAQIGRLRRQVLGRINAELAFRHHQAGTSSQVWRHALGAITNDLAWLRNRGLIRIGLADLFGSITTR